MRRKIHPVSVAAVCVVGVLFLFSILNAGLAVDTVKKLVADELTFEQAVDEIQSRYTSDEVTGKRGFVDLNGLFARLTGRRVYNEIVKGEEGFLLGEIALFDPTSLSKSITKFSDYLEEHEETPFLYIQAPCKEDFEDEVYPYGTSSYGNESADAILSLLRENNIDTLDLRPDLSATPELLEKTFYYTDHHWNADGAFSAFQIITQALKERFPDRGIDLSYTENDQWERHTLENWFLGSQGKRVGQYFVGTDDLTWYTPRFETDMSCIVTKHRALYTGDFLDANIRGRYLESKDYFGDNPYCVYIGGDYPLVQHRNLTAPSDLKILWIKDSFTLPLQAYLSTVFQEIDVVDPRHFTECGITEYAGRKDYDIVIMCINPTAIGMKAYSDLGVEDVAAKQGEYQLRSIFQDDVTLEAAQHAYNHYAIGVEAGKTYRFSFDDIVFSAGSSPGVEVKLYNAQTKKTLLSYLFDAEYCSKTGGSDWVFTVPAVGTDQVQLVLYAGLSAETEGNGVIYKNVTVEELHWTLPEEGADQLVVYQGDIEMEPDDHAYHYYAVDVSGGAAYHLTFDEAVFTEGEATGIDVVLYNQTTRAVLDHFAVEDAGAGADFSFRVPDAGFDDVQLLFYAGLRGATLGNGVIYRNVCLSKTGTILD